MRSYELLSDLFFPRRCIACGTVLGRKEKFLCMECQADIPYTFFWMNPHNPMADKFNSQLSLLECSSLEGYCYACALFSYKSLSPYSHITPHLKYERGISSGRYFSHILGERIKSVEHFSDIDTVIPVPLSFQHRWIRGYNQAVVIGKEIASVLGVRFDRKTLRRTRNTATQTEIDVGNKMSNVLGAFKASFRGASLPRHILLVDDVFTTGATTAACHAALRNIFPPETRISVATLAYVGYR